MAAGLITEFTGYVSGVLAVSSDAMTRSTAAAIAPAVYMSAALAIIAWGIRAMRGGGSALVLDSALKMITIFMIIIFGLNLYAWNAVIANFFVGWSGQISGAITGTADPLGIADQVWTDMNVVAESLAHQGGFMALKESTMAVVVWILGGAAALVIAGLQLTSMVMIRVLLILGPIFLWALMFDATRGFFERFVGQLCTYGFVPLLVAIVGTILLGFMQDYSTRAAANPGVTYADASLLLGASFLICLCMFMVALAAAGLGGGIALSTFGIVSGTASKILQTSRSTAYLGARGVADGWRGLPRSQYQPIRRNLANHVGQLAHSAFSRNGGSVAPRYERSRRRP